MKFIIEEKYYLVYIALTKSKEFCFFRLIKISGIKGLIFMSLYDPKNLIQVFNFTDI